MGVFLRILDDPMMLDVWFKVVICVGTHAVYVFEPEGCLISLIMSLIITLIPCT